MKVPVYNYSLAEARELEEEEKWLESHKANVECKEGIEKAIRENYDGMSLGRDVAKELCDTYRWCYPCRSLRTLQHHDPSFP